MQLFFDEACEFHLPLETAALGETLAPLETRAFAAAREQGLDGDRLVVERIGFLRYRGQFFQSLALPLPDIDGADFNLALRARFNGEYARLYGEGALVMMQDVRLVLPLASRPAAARAEGPAPRSDDVRPVFWPSAMDWVSTAVWDGASLRPGDALEGPAIVELAHTTVAVAPGQRLVADDLGNFLLQLP
jgi:N-methylhydantoinase A